MFNQIITIIFFALVARGAVTLYRLTVVLGSKFTHEEREVFSTIFDAPFSTNLVRNACIGFLYGAVFFGFCGIVFHASSWIIESGFTNFDQPSYEENLVPPIEWVKLESETKATLVMNFSIAISFLALCLANLLPVRDVYNLKLENEALMKDVRALEEKNQNLQNTITYFERKLEESRRG